MASTALRCKTLCRGKPLMNRRAIAAALCGLALLLTYWSRDGVKYVWVAGQYVVAPFPDALWIGGQWVHRGDHWTWVDGHWRRR